MLEEIAFRCDWLFGWRLTDKPWEEQNKKGYSTVIFNPWAFVVPFAKHTIFQIREHKMRGLRRSWQNIGHGISGDGDIDFGDDGEEDGLLPGSEDIGIGTF